MSSVKCKFKDCKERPDCKIKNNPWQEKILCKRYQSYIDQDQIKGKETPFTYVGVNLEEIANSRELFKDSIENRNSLIFQLYFLDKKTNVKDISIHVGCSEITVYKFIERVKKTFIMKK